VGRQVPGAGFRGRWIAWRALLPGALFVTYSGDDMMNPAHQSPRYLQSIDRYELHVTTKSYNVAELAQIGAKDVLFVDNAFDPETHRPIALSAEERARFAADVGFVAPTRKTARSACTGWPTRAFP
jgi:hypothetical protein